MFDFGLQASPVSISVAILALLIVLPITRGLLPKLSALKALSEDRTKARQIIGIGSNERRHETSEVTSLMIYPIKSCRGIKLNKSTLRSQGLDLDRRWMLVEAGTNQFITIRQIPELTLINTGLSDSGELLHLSISGLQDQYRDQVIKVPTRPSEHWLKENTTLAQVKIWDTLTDGYLYGDEVNGLLSRFLNRDVRLVYKGPTARVMQGNGDPRLLGRTQTVNFPDVQPVLIASEASIAELNSRLARDGAEPISIERFRPNIVIKGNVPWSEDSWKLVRIKGPSSSPSTSGKSEGLLDLDIVSRCTRCQVPNVNPDTAQKHRDQPWNTLMAYRRIDEGMKYKPVFGMLGAPRNEGEIAVGMTFEVLEETDQHRYIKGF